MRKSKTCPKCGGQEIAVMRTDLSVEKEPKVRTAGGYFLGFDDFLPVTRYLCCTCGYMESWVDPETFVAKGGREYWEKQETEGQDWEQMDAYWREKLREKKEKEAAQERAEEKRKNRRDDPWT